MTIHSVNYPILFTGPGSFQYKITDETGTVIYTGYSYGKEVDIAPILQQYMNADLVDVKNETMEEGYSFEVNTDSVVKSFTVSDSTTSQTYLVTNDYNSDYVTQYDEDYITSDSITRKYHPDDLIFVDVNSPDKTATIQIGSNTESNFNSAHAIVKNARVEGDGYILERYNRIDGFISNTGSSPYFTYVNGYYIYMPNILNSVPQFAVSTDLENWQVFKARSSDDGRLVDVVYALNKWFLSVRREWLGHDSGIRYADGIMQGYYNSASSLYRESITNFAQNAYLYAVSASSVNTTMYLKYSNSGTTSSSWKSLNLDGIVKYSTNCWIDFTNKLFIATCVGNTTYIYNSTGSEPYLTFSSANEQNINMYRMKVTNNILFIVGQDSNGIGYYMYSTDNGATWNSKTIDANYTITSVAYGNGNYVFTLQNSDIYITNNLFNHGFFINNIVGSDDIIFDGQKFVIAHSASRYSILEIVENRGFIKEITVNGVPYYIEYTAGCERYSIYWVNRLGGRSQLLLEGKCKEHYSNNSTRFTTHADKTNPASFATRTIVNEVTQSWTLTTGLLTDEQSRKMDDLFTSPKVWLHDHETDRVIAVYVTDKQITRKTRKNNRMFSYSISVTQAQNHTRR